MEILLVLVLLSITILPVKLAAGFVGAEKTGFGSITLAVIVGSIIAAILFKVAGGSLVGLFVAFIGVVITYKFILSTTIGYWQRIRPYFHCYFYSSINH